MLKKKVVETFFSILKKFLKKFDFFVVKCISFSY